MVIKIYNTLFAKKNDRPSLIEEGGVEWNGRFSNPRDVVNFMNYAFQASERTEEYAWLITLDVKNRPCGVFELAHGSLDRAIVRPREIFVKALLAGASKIILIHNHPSGNPGPSIRDTACTGRVRSAGNIIGIPLKDHIIIGGDSYYTFFGCGLV